MYLFKNKSKVVILMLEIIVVLAVMLVFSFNNSFPAFAEESESFEIVASDREYPPLLL